MGSQGAIRSVGQVNGPRRLLGDLGLTPVSAAVVLPDIWLPGPARADSLEAWRRGCEQMAEMGLQKVYSPSITNRPLTADDFAATPDAIFEAGEIAKDTERYPGYDKPLEADLRTSLNLFLDEVIWQNAGADFRKLLNASHLPLNERLAGFYGAQRVDHPGEFGPSFFDHDRAGLLTHPYLLSLYSYHNSTSPIHRGVFVTRRVLGRSLKPPPEAVVFRDEAFAPDMTMREKVTQLTKADACMTCHGIINPLGFTLEQFDGVGRLRETERGRPINTVSDYLTADGDAVRLTSAGDLARHAAESPSAQKGFIEMLFKQVAKQPLRAYGSGVLNRLREDFVASGYNVKFLLAETAVINALRGVDAAPPTERN